VRQLVIEMKGDKDRHGRTFYFASTSIPASVNLERTIFLLFPNGEEGARMIIKHHEPKQRTKEEDFDGGSSDPG